MGSAMSSGTTIHERSQRLPVGSEEAGEERHGDSAGADAARAAARAAAKRILRSMVERMGLGGRGRRQANDP